MNNSDNYGNLKSEERKTYYENNQQHIKWSWLEKVRKQDEYRSILIYFKDINTIDRNEEIWKKNVVLGGKIVFYWEIC